VVWLIHPTVLLEKFLLPPFAEAQRAESDICETVILKKNDNLLSPKQPCCLVGFFVCV